MSQNVREGEMTKTVYNHIMQHQYDKAVKLLNAELQNFPTSRCCLSLLGYCYYHMQDLMKAGMYEEALSVCTLVENPEYTERVMLLQAAISYEQDEFQLARSFLDQCTPEAEE